jgi:ABC-type transport system involved in Fe-S cluster assembly fused permease/ATPase subunit
MRASPSVSGGRDATGGGLIYGLGRLSRLARALWREVWRADDPLAKLLVVALLGATILAATLTSATPLVLRALIDEVVTRRGKALEAPVLLIIAFPLMRFAVQVLDNLKTTILTRIGLRAKRAFAVAALQSLHRQGPAFHIRNRAGSVAREMDNGLSAVELLLRLLPVNLFGVVLEIGFILTILLQQMDLPLQLIVLAVVLGYAVVAAWVTRGHADLRRRLNAEDKEASAIAADGLLNYENVRYFGREQFEIERFNLKRRDHDLSALRSQYQSAGMNICWMVLTCVGMGSILTVTAQRVLAGAMTPGALVMINAYMMHLFNPLGALSFIYRDASKAIGDLGELQEMIEAEPEMRDVPGAPALVAHHGRVVFDRVSFSYDGGAAVLHDVSFEIPPGGSVGIVGATGAGKSTITRLLLRLYDPTSGAIWIDGQNIRGVTQSSLRSAIGIVPQDVVLLHESIYLNVAYARPDASAEEVAQALELARLDRFVAHLPQGMDAIVGERGLRLSGGERQRIAVARALLRDPRILVLDEATSSLDLDTEADIQAALEATRSGRSRLTIAHRLSTVADADEILVLDHGRIIERGCHRALLKLGGKYAAMWARQSAATRNLSDTWA